MSLMRKFPYCLVNMKGRVCWESVQFVRQITKTNARFSSKPVKGVNMYNQFMKYKANKKLVVDIYANMKVKELARQLQITPDEMISSLQETAGKDKYRSGEDQIDSIPLLKQMARKYDALFKEKKKVVKKTAPERVKEESVGDFIKSTFSKNKKQEEIKEESPKPAPMPAPMPAPIQHLLPRTPIVTIMGHVDHGKTTLLDALRESSIVDSEFGGITQHIGAFTVKLNSGETITFLDTPGHAAFSSMRSRGASVTDIVVLVVAADDSVMNQTIESIEHAKQANVPIIVAVNKMDKPGASLERTLQDLMKHGVFSEDLGGDVQIVPISALQKTNLDKLQESITAQAEVMDLKADFKAHVRGTVIESKTEKGFGKVATVIVQEGTLRHGDVLLCGDVWAKVRVMHNEHKQSVKECLPGMPVEVIGWRDLPSAGDPFVQVENEKMAKVMADEHASLHQENISAQKQEEIDKIRETNTEKYRALREEKLSVMKGRGRRYSLNRYKAKMYGEGINTDIVEERTVPSFPIVVKCDVDGSLDAIMTILWSFKSDFCTLDVMEFGVGPISDYDIHLAETFNGQIYAFNVSSVGKANSSKVTVKHFNIIYRMMDDLVESITNILPPKINENILGQASVLKEFTITNKKKKIPVAGCRCTKGVLDADKNFKVIREEKVVYTGNIMSLRHHKSEVKTIKAGVECGVCLDPDIGFQIQENDTIVCYEHSEVPQKLDWEPGYST